MYDRAALDGDGIGTRPNGRRIFRDDRPTIGFGISELFSPGFFGLLAAAGVDYGFVDLEHASFSIREVAAFVAGARGTDLPVIVRPPEIGGGWIARLLDIGVDGIVVPRVGSAEEAAEIVRQGKYPPLGVRGDSGRIYGARPRSREAAEHANENTVLMVIVETAEGAEAIDAICETPGIDAVWIGHADLSLSLGVAGDLESEAYRRAEERIVESCRAHGMPWTIGVAPTPAAGLEQARLGAFTVFVDDEVGLITRTLAEYVAEFTSALGAA